MAMGSDAESVGLLNGNTDIVSEDHLDAGAVFVLESKGNWLHAGYHLTTSIVAPALLSLPFAFAALGWVAGVLCLTVGAAVTFYSYNLLSIVLERLESEGNRHLRFRDMARDIIGPRWATFTVAPMQFAVCLGSVIASTLLGGQSLKFIYLIYHPNGAMKLYEFIIVFGIAMLFLSQMPSFHSLRHINLFSLILCLLYSLCAVGGSIHAGHSKLNAEKDYSLTGSSVSKVFGAFNSVAIIATTYGNGILPEIQYQWYTLMEFDEQQSGVPIAWVMASPNTSDDIALWLEHLMHKCFQICHDWKVNAFMVDHALAEITSLRRLTGCDVILCVWNVRKAWLKNVNRLATSSIKANEMFSEDVGEGCRDFPHANQETVEPCYRFKESLK